PGRRRAGGRELGRRAADRVTEGAKPTRRDGWASGAPHFFSGALPLRELGAAAGAAQAVLLPLLHPGVAGQVAGVTELLDHPDGRVGRGRGGRGAVGPGDDGLPGGRGRRRRLRPLPLPLLVLAGLDPRRVVED